MRLRQIDPDSPRDVRRFIRFPVELYRDCPHYVPQLETSARLGLDHHRHPYYAHSEAGFFVVEEGRQILGRITPMHNRLHNDYYGVKTAFFGFFDAVDDTAVSRALFEAAERYVADLCGAFGRESARLIGDTVREVAARSVLQG